MTPPRERKRPSGTATNTALTPSTEQLRVGDIPPPAPAGPAKPVRAARKTATRSAAPAAAPVRVPFGTYLPPDLQKQFKARCVLLGIEMRDGVEDAIRAWLDANPV
ncbi:hypothetical protein [Streptomyces sp. PH10-H1]|uniref:hypothetical protein n=1 Tax=Streptomyces sp. PH10-H1 TaxID=3046212 RepID=UPI0024BAE625|nr:hypothetical protein [Streptomyces sp. PH10-H1]MDJ0347505.1 hypothetical protein [Streptomyces sp. PH10-H1]